MSATIHTRISRVNGNGHQYAEDVLAVEEPLEIRLSYSEGGIRHEKAISVTMRTPGADAELAIGFLFTEGIIAGTSDVTSTVKVRDNVMLITLADSCTPAIGKLDRNFYTTSSCGVCGKASIDAVRTVCAIADDYPYDGIKIPVSRVTQLPETLRRRQQVFEQTGGLHACALFSLDGELLMLREDVGRHNALDKLVGAALKEQGIPISRHLLMLSGRASFELVQKAAMAGIRVVAAVGAPSSLAVQMAEDSDMTIIGFLRGDKFNIYAGAQRIELP